MKLAVSFLRGLAIVALFFVGMLALSAQKPETQGPPPDNSKVNQRDRGTGAPTADQQKNNSTDRDITRRIRRQIVKDKSLSTYAHNVKVITRNGGVTLRGPVRSEDEKTSIQAKAAAVVGEANVKNELEIAPPKKKS